LLLHILGAPPDKECSAPVFDGSKLGNKRDFGGSAGRSQTRAAERLTTASDCELRGEKYTTCVGRRGGGGGKRVRRLGQGGGGG